MVDVGSRAPCSVVAAAGCGKTETIARSVKAAAGRQLVLTHTNAGVEALRRRMRRQGVSDAAVGIDTIAGWCLKFVTSYPRLARWQGQDNIDGGDWYDDLYPAMGLLLEQKAIQEVVRASYAGAFVDEYQDCTPAQHELVRLLATHVPTCVLGDPLQAVFRFRGPPPDWATQVEVAFPRVAELTEPHRWLLPGRNADLGRWLAGVRSLLQRGQAFSVSPSPARYVATPSFGNWANEVQRVAFEVAQPGETVAAVAKWPSDAHRVGQLTGGLFQCVESLAAKDGVESAIALGNAQPSERVQVLSNFLRQISTGFDSAWATRTDATGAYTGPGSASLSELTGGAGPRTAAEALDALSGLEEVRIYRRELLWAFCDSLRLAEPNGFGVLAECFRKVRNLTSHRGRRLARCCVGSTLLLKGMEFDHAIVIDTGAFTLNDYYVAITRGATSLTILAPSPIRDQNFAAS
jgi:UvrD/REP helicase N-terminal domain